MYIIQKLTVLQLDKLHTKNIKMIVSQTLTQEVCSKEENFKTNHIMMTITL